MAPLKIAVMGAGLIGKRHAAHVRAEPGAVLSAIIDPAPAGKAFAAEIGVAWYPGFDALPAAEMPDGVIVATPNQLHVANGLELVAAGEKSDAARTGAIGTMIESPLATPLSLKLVVIPEMTPNGLFETCCAAENSTGAREVSVFAMIQFLWA